MRRKRRTRWDRRRLFAGISSNGRLVHLVTRSGATSPCGQKGGGFHKVKGRVTCRFCAARAPWTTFMHSELPHVIGIDWEPLYRRMRMALRAGLKDETPAILDSLETGFRLIVAPEASSP